MFFLLIIKTIEGGKYIMKNIGIIGAGNMGMAIIQGLLQKGWKEKISFIDLSKQRCQWVYEQTGVVNKGSIEELISEAEIIVLAIKPQFYQETVQQLKYIYRESQILVSIAPGISIASIQQWIDEPIRIVRAMPNTPAVIGEGMSVLCFSEGYYTEEDRKAIHLLFESLGQVAYLEEYLMDAVVPISGSAPAYVYMMIEAMGDAGVLQGIPRELAYRLAAQALLGSARMVLETQVHPGALKDQVCSPGGTTIEAVRILEKKGFRSAIIEAMEGCYQKTKEF